MSSSRSPTTFVPPPQEPASGRRPAGRGVLSRSERSKMHLRGLLEQLLPPLQIRIRTRRVDALIERIAALADPAAKLWEESPANQLASLAVLLVRVVGRLQQKLGALDRTIAGHVDAYARARTPELKRRRLELMIEETAPSRRSAAIDRRALRRNLDLDALRERYDDRRERLIVLIELGIMAFGPALRDALARAERDEAANIHELLFNIEPARFLAEQLALIRHWPSRLACLESLDTVLHVFELPSESGHWGHRQVPDRQRSDLIRVLATIGRDRNDHEWVQARAITTLRRLSTVDARVIIRERLGLDRDPTTAPVWPKRDFLVRRLLIADLARHLDDSADLALLERALERGEPSEFARVGHCKALIELVVARPESFAVWAQWLARGPAEGNSAGPEETPRVRAWALLCLVRAVHVVAESCERESEADSDRLAVVVEPVADRLRDAIAREQHTLVALIACEQAVALATLLAGTALADRLSDFIASFEPPLHRCLADGQRPAKIHETAAATLEALDRALRPERIAWTEQLGAAIAAIEPGGAGAIDVPSHAGVRPDERELGRIFAELTRNDWGVDVEPARNGRRLWVRRGEHRVTRVWRILHELRNLSSNKRQAFRHTVGRSYQGRLRAHPSRLDEVTATVVPGERLQIDLEGGWGRQLPLVDDLLGLPWLAARPQRREVVISSSYGVTRLRLTGGLWQRLRRRLRLNLRYAQLSELRRRVLFADEPTERRRYIDELRDQYGVEVVFAAHPPLPLAEATAHPIPPRVAALFPTRASGVIRPRAPEPRPIEAEDGRPEVVHSLALATVLTGFGEHAPLDGDWLRGNLHYFLTLEGNSQEALGLYGLALFALFLGSSHVRRRAVANARARIPLSVGGWGTRGKSGTERLKAGMFHGLGFRTFSKTTGCEAMFIHAAPAGPQVEIFTFRPYNKATIWEQRNLLELAAGLEAEVFLWECMALNPEYVDIMQRGWMRDDYATLTNTYPDHEDIQGPAGIDVATVIGNFVPQGNLVISSELGFNPVLRAAAARRECEFVEIGDHDGDLMCGDLLGLFPYSEHPRNIALVTELARQIGIDDELAIVCMADYVYPDLGVLKFYPEVVVRGRRLNFVNGCSANERAGFLNNWKRTGCVELAANADPERMVITVVNNRDDRVARSEVFSRILVNDVTVDAHVLIGTNLAGLSIFIDRALANFVAEQEVVEPGGLAEGGEADERARKRLRTLLNRVRAPVDGWWERLCGHLRVGLAAIGRRFDPLSPAALAFREFVNGWRSDVKAGLDFDATRSDYGKDREIQAALERVHDESAEDPGLITKYEVLAVPTWEDFAAHFELRVVKIIIAGRAAAWLERVLESRSATELSQLTTKLLAGWTQMFRSQIIVVWNSGSSGDQVIEACAKAVPPGVNVTIMGTQNIKGTGLDFIYRWLSLDLVSINLAKLEHPDEKIRLDALRVLDGNSDNGFTDTGMLVARLPEITGGTALEQNMRQALYDKAHAIWKQKVEKMAAGSGAGAKGGRFYAWVEAWFDFIDGAMRYWKSRQLVSDLIHFRISHNKMAVEMREIYARAKGGWLSKWIAARGLKRRQQEAIATAPEAEPLPGRSAE
jgi:poly-gamma-glutamate synthase PgsB/CapB